MLCISNDGALKDQVAHFSFMHSNLIALIVFNHMFATGPRMRKNT